MPKPKYVITLPSKFRQTVNLLEQVNKRVGKHCLIDPVNTSAGVSETKAMIDYAIEHLQYARDVLDGVKMEDE